MKKILLTLLGLVIVTSLWASDISEEQARQIAAAFWSTDTDKSNSAIRRAAAALQLAYKPEANELYVYNCPDGQGWVIVAGDDGTRRQVLAYSKTGSFDYAKAADGAKAILSQYVDEITYLRQNGSSVKRRALGYDNAPGNVVVAPLIKSEWNQIEPYWNQTPGQTYTGCVITAATQLMYYYQWPKQGYGTHTNTKELNQKRDFNHAYDWDNMLDKYTNGNYTEAQANAVAQLMADMGCAADAHYGMYYGTGAYDKSAYYALVTNFGYSRNARLAYSSDGFPNEEWETLLKAELDAGRPLYYSADGSKRPPSGGHAFICDGYDDAGYFHFNLGWGGSQNAYYLTSSISTDGYWTNPCAIVGLQPSEYPRVCIDNVFYELVGSEAVVVGCNDESFGEERNLVIPATITVEGKPYNVTDLWQGAFHHALISSIDIQAPAKKIYDGMFSESKKLKTVRLPDSVEEIGRDAFSHCTAMTEIEIGKGIRKIHPNAFLWCNSMTSVGFYGYLENLEEVCDSAFLDCQKLESFPGFSSAIKKIGERAFCGCAQLTSAHFSDKARDFIIGECAYYNSGINRVSGLEHALGIGRSAFYNWNPTLEGTFTVSPTCIYDEGAVVGRFDKIILPANLTNYDPKTVSGTKAYEVEKGNKVYSSMNGMLLDKQGKTLIRYPDIHDPVCIIPEGVEKINNGALVKIMHLTLPASLKEMGSLSSLNYDVMYVTFMATTPPAATSETFPSGIFEYNRSELHVPYGSKAAYEADAVWGKFNIITEDIYVSGKFIYSLTEGTTYDLDENFNSVERKYYYASVAARNMGADYDGVVNANDFLKKIKLNGHEYPVRSIDKNVFYGDKKLKSLTLPDFIESVDGDAFINCENLESIHFGKNAEDLGFTSYPVWNPLSNCPKLHTITVADDNETYFVIDNMLFKNDGMYTPKKSLCYVTPVTKNGNALAYRTTVRIPDGTQSIYDGVFDERLKNVVIPASVEDLNDAFVSCSNLAVVTNLATTPQDTYHGLFDAIRDMKIVSGTLEVTIKATLQVPTGCKEVYANHEAWGCFQNIVEIDPNNFSPGEDNPSVFPDVPDDEPAEPIIQDAVAVYRTNGEVEYFTFDGRPTITYQGDNLVMACGNQHVQYTLKGLEKIAFTTIEVTGLGQIQEVEGVAFNFHDDQIVIANAKAGEVVKLYDTTGRLFDSSTVGSDGRLTLSLSALTKGIYIIKMGTTSYKILRK